MLGIPLALAVFGYGEWATHKYLLHGLGRDKRSKLAFHFHEHHQAVRRNGGVPVAFERIPQQDLIDALDAAEAAS